MRDIVGLCLALEVLNDNAVPIAAYGEEYVYFVAGISQSVSLTKVGH